MAAASLARQALLERLQAEFGDSAKPGDAGGRPDSVLSFRQFVDQVYPRYQWYKHSVVLANVLQRVADGELKRVLIQMPPRHGKSLLASRLFPAYLLYRNPQNWAAITSYSAELAYSFSRAAREAYRFNGGNLRDDAASVKVWELPEGGGLWATGVGGSATGRGFSTGLIDDPVRGAKDASSKVIKEGQRDWYQSVFSTRAEPDAAIIVIQTRWSEDDLTGWLLEQEIDDDPECWHVVCFEAIKTDAPYKLPATCTIEPDWRAVGEALCPERYPVGKLSAVKKRIGSFFFDALYQQRPAPASGNLFKRDWWQFYRVPPAKLDQVVLSVDCAFKGSDSSDFVVMQVWGKREGEYFLLDQTRGRMDINATLLALRSMVAKHPNARAKLVEDKANGSAVIDLLKRQIAGLIPINPEGGKLVRATAVAPFVESGNVYLPDPDIAPWVGDFIEEAAAFPNGANDDQVDSLSQAINWLEANKPQGIRRSGLQLY